MATDKTHYRVTFSTDYGDQYTWAIDRNQAIRNVVTKLRKKNLEETGDGVVYYGGKQYGKDTIGVLIRKLMDSPDTEVAIIKQREEKDMPEMGQHEKAVCERCGRELTTDLLCSGCGYKEEECTCQPMVDEGESRGWFKISSNLRWFKEESH